MTDAPYTPWVVCAAIKMQDGLIVTGARHYSPDMRAIMRRVYGEGYHLKEDEQGFIDQRGRFLTREEAYVIAKTNGQIRFRCGGDTETLYSESLY